MKINIQDKELKAAIKKHSPLMGSSGFGFIHEVNHKSYKDGQHVGTIETDERIYDCYIVQSDYSMRTVFGHSKWSLRFVGRENEADRLEKIETGKWLLSKGVITAEQAKEEYGYEGLTN